MKWYVIMKFLSHEITFATLQKKWILTVPWERQGITVTKHIDIRLKQIYIYVPDVLIIN